MKLLVSGHSLIIDANRKFWNVLAQKNGATVDLIAPENWSSNLSQSIPFKFNPDTDGHCRKIYTLPTFFKGNGSFYFIKPWHLSKVFWSNKYDVIFLNQETWALSTLTFIICKLFSPNYKSKLFLCVAQNLKKDKLKFLHQYERIISFFIYRFLYCSSEVEQVLRWKGIQTSASYFPLPYDDSMYKVTPILKDHIFRIGYLGRISEDKGILILLEACDQLAIKNFSFKLIIGGNGPLVEEIKKKSYVEYLGLIPHNQAYQFYQKIDCFILPSQTRLNWKEQFGRVIVESFGAGKPVIGSTSGSIPEVLGKNHWPWLFKENSSSELARKIEEIYQYLKTDNGQAALSKAIKLNFEQFSQSEQALSLFREFQK